MELHYIGSVTATTNQENGIIKLDKTRHQDANGYDTVWGRKEKEEGGRSLPRECKHFSRKPRQKPMRTEGSKSRWGGYEDGN